MYAKSSHDAGATKAQGLEFMNVLIACTAGTWSVLFFMDQIEAEAVAAASANEAQRDDVALQQLQEKEEQLQGSQCQ